jgi:O-antigen ligase
MTSPELAEVGAIVGALGSLLALAGRGRAAVAAGFVLLAAAEAALVVWLIPADDLRELASPLAVGAIAVGLLVVAGLAAAFVRAPDVVPLVVLVAAPFRVPVTLGGQEAFLLLPLYAVLAAAAAAFLYRLARGAPADPLPQPIAFAAGIFVALSAVSLVWALDRKDGTIELLFFLFPFVALAAIVARGPIAAWLPRALAATLVGLASLFAAVGLWQSWSGRIFFAPDVEVANAYNSFFRATSLFKDPSLYGRHLVVALVVVLIAVWLRAVGHAVAAVVVALLVAGLYVSYSQSSLATLFVMTVAVTLVLGDRRARQLVVAACVALAIATAAYVAVTVDGESARELTSGRSRLVSVTLPLIREHPIAGVGIGSQPRASNEHVGADPESRRNASHTTPLTVAAELGLVGLAAYVAFILAAGWTFVRAAARERPLGLALAAVFAALFLHSLAYAGFFEDPLTWGTLALAANVVARGVRRPVTEDEREAAPVAAPRVAVATPRA